MKLHGRQPASLLLALALACVLALPARAADVSADFTYGTSGEAVHLAADTLADCAGTAFAYVTFTLPSGSAGTLYYNYIDSDIYEGAVASGTRYYASGEPSADKIWFVPASGYTGTVSIPFTAYDGTGSSLATRTLRVTVTDNGSAGASASSSAFLYAVGSGRSVTLTASDFTDRCRIETGSSLDYIRFTSLPPSSQGTLYNGTANSGNLVAVNRSYSSPGSLRFVANAGYTGTVTVPFVGYGTNGSYFDAALQFNVGGDGVKLLDYTIEPGRRVYFLTDDFADACYAATGYDIYRIHIDSLPSSSQGTLYNGGSTAVTTGSSTYYYKSSLSNLNFYASGSFAGSVSIRYTGYASGYTSSNGRSFSGTITIRSTSAAASGTSPDALVYTTTGLAVTLDRQDLLNAVSGSLFGTPSTIRFTAPERSVGQLCVDFASLSRYSAFDPEHSYAFSDVSRISYLPKSGFRGTAYISYTATDANGSACTGSILFIVTPPSTSAYFYDMDDCVWAIPAVDFFYHYGAVNGTGRSAFGPNAGMRRGDFVLLLSRAFSLPSAGAYSYPDVPEDSYYAAAIASAKALGIVTGSTATRFLPEDPISREDAAIMIYRCLNRITTVTPGTAADLAQFPDAGNTSSYAIEAMGALVKLGVFTGDAGRLRPRMTLSRAETITILYRALT